MKNNSIKDIIDGFLRKKLPNFNYNKKTLFIAAGVVIVLMLVFSKKDPQWHLHHLKIDGLVNKNYQFSNSEIGISITFGYSYDSADASKNKYSMHRIIPGFAPIEEKGIYKIVKNNVVLGPTEPTIRDSYIVHFKLDSIGEISDLKTLYLNDYPLKRKD